MKATSEQLARVRQLCRFLKVTGPQLRSAMGEPLTAASTTRVGTLLRILNAADTLPRPARDSILNAVRAELAPNNGWRHSIEPLVADTACDPCRGTGRVTAAELSNSRLLAVFVGTRGGWSASQVIRALRSPTFSRLQHMASFFDGDLNAAADFARSLVDQLETKGTL